MISPSCLIRFQGFADIVMMPGNELVESLANSYYQVGQDETMVITRSNKRANIYNNGIRNMVLDREEELSGGDMLMIVKNNYYWTENERKQMKASGDTPEVRKELQSIPSFLANGDRAKVCGRAAIWIFMVFILLHFCSSFPTMIIMKSA